MARTSATLRTARWSAEHPWRAILIWVLFVAAGIGLGSAVSTIGTSNADYRVGDSGIADRIIADAGLKGPNTENVLISSKTGPLPTEAARSAAAEIRTGMRDLVPVRAVQDPIWSAGHQAVLVSVTLRGSPDDDPDISSLQTATERVQARHPDLVVAEVGDASINSAINDRVARDLGTAEHVSLPITLIIMLLAFGALIAAGIPVLLAISAVIATIGLLAPLSHLMPAEATASSMVLLIGMAVGVDYSLFYLKRAREERRKGSTALDAVEIAAATSGHSIVVSGAAVIVSMAGLYLAQDVTFASLASGAIMVVAVAVAGSLTVLPALLVKLGRWVDRPRIPFLGKRMARVETGAITRRVISPVMRKPGVALLVAGGAVVLLALPALGLKIHQGNLSTLPQDVPEVQTMQRVDRLFPSQGDTLQVVAETRASAMPQVKQALSDLDRAAGRTGDLTPTANPDIRISADQTVAVLTLTTPYGNGSPRGDAALTQLRNVLGPHALGRLPHTQWVVGGGIAESTDTTTHEKAKLPYVIGFVLLLTLLMMGITFRSVVIALVTTVLNLASVGAAFGVLALVFQHSWADGLLGYTSSGFVVDWIPLFTFVVLMGLSMDYHVFVLSRVREGLQRGLPPRLAVEVGLSQTAGVVTSAAAVMVSVFTIFTTLSMLEMKQIGIGLAAAVLIDATLVRVVILPAILVLLGKLAWWPTRVRRPAPTPDVALKPVPVYSSSTTA